MKQSNGSEEFEQSKGPQFHSPDGTVMSDQERIDLDEKQLLQLIEALEIHIPLIENELFHIVSSMYTLLTDSTDEYEAFVGVFIKDNPNDPRVQYMKSISTYPEYDDQYWELYFELQSAVTPQELLGVHNLILRELSPLSDIKIILSVRAMEQKAVPDLLLGGAQERSGEGSALLSKTNNHNPTTIVCSANKPGTGKRHKRGPLLAPR